jgi:lipopolysaccharide transport system permease protein
MGDELALDLKRRGAGEVAAVPASQPWAPTLTIKPRQGFVGLDLHELWAYRELLYFLVWRDLKVRYKQTALGVAWVVLQPLAAVLLFTVIFGELVKMPSDGVPYPLFAYAALLPWNFFAGTMTRASTSLVNNQNLITKIYFPRLVIPVAAVLAGLPDMAISFLVFLGFMVWFGVWPTAAVLTLPLFLLLATAAALGVGLWLSALNVQYRDINHLVPFLVQVWMYASPVIYSASLIPERWRWLYGLNPMAGVIDGFRWALLARPQPPDSLLGLSTAVVVLLLVTGVICFQRMEDSFADVI